MEEENKTPKESSIVFKKSLKRKKENHKTSQVDGKNNILVDLLETDNKKQKRTIKSLEVEDNFNSLLQEEREKQERERRKNEDLQKEPLASHIKRGKWNDALLEACKIGNKEIVELMIEKGGSDWNGGLKCACYGGLIGACKGGNKEIVELMIEKGADNWNEGLSYACQGGNRNS